MLIRYRGGRSQYEVSYDRKPYYFTPENNRTLDIQDPKVINYIFGLPNRMEFEAIEKPPEPKVEEVIEPEKSIVKKSKKSKKKKGGK